MRNQPTTRLLYLEESLVEVLAEQDLLDFKREQHRENEHDFKAR